ncbi:MAG: putative bifunctional diguanylate cyclase/phosphodiesterase [Pseudomonadota bacterium]
MLLAYFIGSPDDLTRAQILKGWFFVSVTSVLLFFMVLQAVRQIESTNELDDLTGLVRHHTFQRELEALLQRRASGQAVVLMYLDIRYFAKLNQAVGFDRADRILSDFAGRLKENYTAGTLLGRLGTDQFAVARLTGDSREQTEAAINQLRQVFDQNARAHNQELESALGVATAPIDAQNAKELMAAASDAVGKAKMANRSVQFFNKALSEEESQREALLEDLREAIDNESLTLAYQPQYDLQSGKINGVEVLIRWNHPELGFVPPDQFIVLAEQNNLIDRISSFVIRKAHQELEESGLLDNLYRVSINISAVEFNSTALMKKLVEEVKKATGLSGKLQMEITETAALSEMGKSTAIIEQLKRSGIRFSIDDFGTGYTSLAILRDLPIDEVKIDRSFIDGLENDPKAHGIVKAIVGMARGFNMICVAEGIETEEQRDTLAQLGCHEAQGYFLARPMDVKKLAEVLKNRRT